MWLSTLLTACLAVSSVPVVLGYPGMGKALNDIRARKDDKGDSFELLGDLATLPDKQLTPVGKDLKKLLTGSGDPESNERYPNAPALSNKKCKEDTCCVWKYIADDMFQLFQGRSGRCTKWARFAVRLGFHDAGTWSKQTDKLGGGADGSIVRSGANGERKRGENRGLTEIIEKMEGWYAKYNTQLGFAITMADLIQMGATVATVTCPLGPRIRSYVGRPDAALGFSAPEGLLPPVDKDADFLIQLFKDKTIGPHGLVALVGAHTTSQQRFVNETRALDPQDSTPGVWDVKFYGETLGKKNGGVTAPKRVFKFHSDIVLSVHKDTSEEWKEFAGKGGQDHWNEVRTLSISSLLSFCN
jgi:manganese peroxidase